MAADFYDSLWKLAQTVAINGNASPITVHATPAGVFFVVFHVFLQAEADVDINFESGTTDLSGLIAFSAALGGYSGGGAEREFKNNGAPIFKGRAAGDNFALTLSAGVQINGFAVIAEVTQ